jgi:hypothetical protein
MAFAWPRRQDEKQSRVAARAHFVALGRIEDGQQTRAAADRRFALGDLDLAVDDDEVGTLVDLMVPKRLAGRQVQDDGTRFAARGAQDHGLA